MKKVLSLVLCLLMCTAILPLFASCANKQQQIDLANAQIVYADNLNKLSTRELNNMRKVITDNTGASVSLVPEKNAAIGATKYEILVGNTTRKETEKALKGLAGKDGYTIQVVKNTVVIVGTNDALTYLAIREFEENYLSQKTDNPTIGVTKKTTKDDCTLLSLLNGGKVPFTIIYSSDCDNTKSGQDDDVKITQKLDIYDLEYRLILNFVESFKSATKYTPRSEKDSIPATEFEVLVGSTTRPESAQALSQIGEEQYIITTINNKIVINAWNDDGLRLAMEKFTEIVSDCIVKDGSTVTGVYPADLTYIGKFGTSWITNFPKPSGENVRLVGTCDVSDGQVEYCYDGADKETFDAYVTQLCTQGYEIYSDTTLEGSRFTTLNNKAENISLHVTYSQYKHAEVGSKFTPKIRVISGRLSTMTQPTVQKNLNYKKVFTDENIGANTGALICQMYLRTEESNVFGNAYLTMLEDGSFILYDGGGNIKSTSNRDTNINGGAIVEVNEPERLLSLVRDLQGLVGLRASGEFTFAAWMMSHAHWDHYKCFQDFCKAYGSTVKLEAAYGNFISESEGYNSHNPGPNINFLNTALDQTNGNGKYVKVHTGQTFWIRNAEVEVLYTHEDLYPETLSYFNDSSTVFRIHYHVTDGQGNFIDNPDGATTCVWLGDLWQKGSKILSAMYGKEMAADMVQVAHHGYNGCYQELYEQIAPTLVWWPVYGANFVSQAYGTGGSYHLIADRYIANTQESVKWILVAGAITSADASGYNIKDMFSKDENGNPKYEALRHNYTLRITNEPIDGDKLYYAAEGFTGVGNDKFTGKPSAYGKGYNAGN